MIPPPHYANHTGSLATEQISVSPLIQCVLVLEKAHNKLIREWLGVICKCHINMPPAFVAPKDFKVNECHF